MSAYAYQKIGYVATALYGLTTRKTYLANERKVPFVPCKSIFCDGAFHNKSDYSKTIRCCTGLNAVKMCLVNELKIPFDPDESMCCNGTFHNKSDYSQTIRCCTGAKSIYFPDSHVCCGSIVRPISDIQGNIYKCCKSKTDEKFYKENEDLCCNGKLYKGTKRGHFGCCGTIAYNPLNARCCNTKVHRLRFNQRCCGDHTYNELSHDCFEKKVLSNYQRLCGGIIYDLRRSHCCGETLHNIAQPNKYIECCGTQLWRTDEQNCVKGQILPKRFSLCGASRHDSMLYGCCEGTIMKKNGTSWDCCGSQMINYLTENCCGKKKFIVQNEICCGGSVFPVGGKCCAGQYINPKTQLCCSQTLETKEHIILKTSNSQNMCCPHSSGGIPYDSNSQMCTWENNVVFKNDVSYCGRKKIMHDKDLCCNYKLHRNHKVRGLECCRPGFKTYNPRTHTCCHGVPKRGNSCRHLVQNVKTGYSTTKINTRCPKQCRKVYKISARLKDLMKKHTNKVLTEKVIRRIKKKRKTCLCIYIKKMLSKRRNILMSKKIKRKKTTKPLTKRRYLAGIIVQNKQFYFICRHRIKILNKYCSR